MLAVPVAAAAKIPHLPESPGVYLWKDAEGRVLYVGKAKRLRSRVRSYFAGDGPIGAKTEFMLRQVADVETIVVPTEAHALILEALERRDPVDAEERQRSHIRRTRLDLTAHAELFDDRSPGR